MARIGADQARGQPQGRGQRIRDEGRRDEGDGQCQEHGPGIPRCHDHHGSTDDREGDDREELAHRVIAIASVATAVTPGQESAAARPW